MLVQACWVHYYDIWNSHVWSVLEQGLYYRQGNSSHEEVTSERADLIGKLERPISKLHVHKPCSFHLLLLVFLLLKFFHYAPAILSKSPNLVYSILFVLHTLCLQIHFPVAPCITLKHMSHLDTEYFIFLYLICFLFEWAITTEILGIYSNPGPCLYETCTIAFCLSILSPF